MKESIKNGVWLYLLQIFNTIIPLITIPYITRVFGPEKYGVFSTSLNIITYFQVIVEYGFGMSATRRVAIAAQKEDQSKIISIFNTVLYSRLFLFIICVLGVGLICFITGEKDNTICLIILLSSLIGYCIQQNWLFLGMQEMKYISIINIVARTISTILIFCLVKNKSDIFVYCFLYAVSPLISGIIGLLIAYKRYDLSFISPKIATIVDGLKNGWYVFTTQFSAKVLNIIGITFLGWFTTNYEVGIFSAINKIPNMIVLVWSPISQVIFPISSKKMNESVGKGISFVYRLRRIFLTIFTSGIILAIIFSERIVEIAFGVEYSPYYYLVIPQLIFVIFAINNNFWGCQILLGGGYEREYSRCFQISVICTVLLNLILIYFFGKNGASYCSLLSEILLSLLLYFRIRGIRNEKQKL